MVVRAGRKVRVYTYMDDDVYEELKSVCSAREWSVSAGVKHLIMRGMGTLGRDELGKLRGRVEVLEEKVRLIETREKDKQWFTKG